MILVKIKDATLSTTMIVSPNLTAILTLNQQSKRVRKRARQESRKSWLPDQPSENFIPASWKAKIQRDAKQMNFNSRSSPWRTARNGERTWWWKVWCELWSDSSVMASHSIVKITASRTRIREAVSENTFSRFLRDCLEELNGRIYSIRIPLKMSCSASSEI